VVTVALPVVNNNLLDGLAPIGVTVINLKMFGSVRKGYQVSLCHKIF
jgi:hypothetical protein